MGLKTMGVSMGAVKIATYNVNSIRSRLHIVIPWLQRNRPTVFCMQETKVEDDKFPVKAFEDAGYHVVYKGEKRYNGVALASLERPEDGKPAMELIQAPRNFFSLGPHIGKN